MTDKKHHDRMTEGLGVAEAKRRFSELVDRVDAGEQFLILRRGKPAVALVSPAADAARAPAERPIGLAAVAGALADWDDLDRFVQEIYAARGQSRDRQPPELG